MNAGSIMNAVAENARVHSERTPMREGDKRIRASVDEAYEAREALAEYGYADRSAR